MSQEHLEALCSGLWISLKGPSGRRYVCSDRHDDLLEVFGIDVSDLIHPKTYCHPCNNIIYHTHITHTQEEASDGKL